MPKETTVKYICDLCNREEMQSPTEDLSTSGRWDVRTLVLFQGNSYHANNRLKVRTTLTCYKCTSRIAEEYFVESSEAKPPETPNA